jgi:hypothetical protein
VPALAAAQGSVRVYVPTPTPTPHRAGFGGGVAPSVANLPAHSPVSLDFGGAWDGEKQVRTFSLTSNGKGYLSAEIQKGPFHIVEYREMGLPIRSQNGQQVGANVKLRIPYADNESRALTWQIDPNVEVQLDVAFNPKFDLAAMTAGDKNLGLVVRGPGPYGGWQLSVPLHGVFHGVHLLPTLLVKDREPVLVRPADAIDVAVDVISPGSAVSGTLRGVGLPAGVTVDPVGVTVPAGGTTSTKVRVHASTAFPADGVFREIGLRLDVAGGPAAGFALAAVPPSIEGGAIDRTDCDLHWGVAVHLVADGHVTMTVTAENRNFVEAKSITVEAHAAGIPFGNPFHSPLWVDARSTKGTTEKSAISLADYVRIARSPQVTFACVGR